ncbi:hypothetical protein LPTSP4_06400 [Leptospira ryugenii]|uniref:Tetratricopeptide repeat protein n=1 Tax=Leptospira ryugenii TaxID=1917863 RepID=A0A2P2DX28_9LEPT|nr:hypothetical protein [Leptospira ryugenii]GBF49130.1 hypothetical protein LPTSP4_06400 [Leptospira ryugenii]
MRKAFLFSLFFLLFAFFALASQAIVSVKLQELRFGILRDQLMNYELSSQTLRERLKQMFLSKDDYITEVKVNILESGIMNSETKGLDLEMGIKDRFGLIVINFVRALNFKPFLELEEQQKTILRLQFAFYMERTRKYAIAAKKYEELEESLNGSLSDEHAFTLLHHGYCLVMMGDRNHAFVKLQKAIDLFPGTHYAENAELLISFLQDSEKNKSELEKLNKRPEDRAILSFQTGDYEGTLKALESLPKLTNDQSYIKARSMEELGITSNAVKEYIQLVKQKENKEIAIKANRRLLLIGNFYQENKSLVEFSKNEATKLGDEKAATQIEEGKTLALKPMIVEKILKAETESSSKEDVKELAEIKDSLKESLIESKEENTKLLTVVKEEKIPVLAEDLNPAEKQIAIEEKVIEKKDIPPPKKVETKMYVRMRDGREVTCEVIVSDGALAHLNLGSFKLSVPLEMVAKVYTNEGTDGKTVTISGAGKVPSVGNEWRRNQEGVWMSKENSDQRWQDEEIREIRLR